MSGNTRITNGKGHLVGLIQEMGGGNKIARDERGHVISKYWADGNLTTDLRSGKLVGLGDQTMRTLPKE